MVLGGNFLQCSRPTVYICHFLVSLLFKVGAGRGYGTGVLEEKLLVWRGYMFTTALPFCPHSQFLFNMFKFKLVSFSSLCFTMVNVFSAK